MKTNALFEESLARVSPETRAEVNLNIDISNRIHDILKSQGLSQRELAKRMGKTEAEVSRWLTGEHGFTTRTISRISSALGEPIVNVYSAITQ